MTDETTQTPTTTTTISLPDDIDTKEIKLCSAFDDGCESCQ